MMSLKYFIGRLPQLGSTLPMIMLGIQIYICSPSSVPLSFHLNTWNESFALSVAVRIKLYSLSYAQNAVSALSSHDLMVRETTRRKTVQFKEAEWNRS